METSVLIWLCVVGLFLLLVIVNIAGNAIHRNHGIHSHRIITRGTEREEFFVPGDPSDKDDLTYEDD